MSKIHLHTQVAKSKESWKRFFTAGKYMERMAEARKRVETAVDLIQKHLIVDTKSEVLKITAMLKNEVWGHLTDMQCDVVELKIKVEAGFAELKKEFKHVNEKLDRILEQDSKLDQLIGMVAQSEARTSEPVLTHATIPPEVPELPAALQVRPALLEEMKQRVLCQASTTAVVGVSRGAAATTSAHGMVRDARTHARTRAHTCMNRYTNVCTHARTHARTYGCSLGRLRTCLHSCIHTAYTYTHTSQGGVGKTTAAVQLIRDPEVGAAFERLLWVSVSQEVLDPIPVDLDFSADILPPLGAC